MKQLIRKFLWMLLAGGLLLTSLNFALNGTLAVMTDQVASGVSKFIAGTWDDSNCTHSIGYWKEHPESWPVDGITIGGITYPKEEALLLFDTPSKGDATYILAYQLIAAKLNILNGAEPGFLDQTIQDADEWLVVNPVGSKPKNPTRKVGLALAEVLEMYNTGEIGPGMCMDEEWSNISSAASFWSTNLQDPPVNDLDDLDFSATPIGMLPELPGTPITIHTPEQTEIPHSLPESEPPSTSLPTQPAEPTQIDLLTPTLAPTQDPNDVLTITPDEGLSSPPTAAPTADLSPTETGIPVEPPQPTPTTAPTAYAGPPGCTQPLEYWTMDPGTWPVDEFYFAEVVYDQESALGILLANPQGDATYVLAKQYITAQLNIASPADPTTVMEVLDSVKTWFTMHPLGSIPKNPDRKEGLEYASLLEEYNLGLQGPGACQLPTPTPTSTSTGTPESLLKPTSAPTMAPTFMPTPTPGLPTETLP